MKEDEGDSRTDHSVPTRKKSILEKVRQLGTETWDSPTCLRKRGLCRRSVR